MSEIKKDSYRLQVALSFSLYEKIEAYADTMGVGMTEASRHLMLRGLEQVQLLMQSRNSVDALNRMTAVFDKGMEREDRIAEAKAKKKSSKSSSVVRSPKKVRVLVTPAQRLKNETNQENIEDIFK